MITERKELLVTILNDATRAQKAFSVKESSEHLSRIEHSCETDISVDQADKQMLNAIKQKCETAQEILKSCQHCEDPFVDCLRQIITKVKERQTE